jgi:hypothetical protein
MYAHTLFPLEKMQRSHINGKERKIYEKDGGGNAREVEK